MTPDYEYRSGQRAYYREPESVAVVTTAVGMALAGALAYVLVVRFHFRPFHLIEFVLYTLCVIAAALSVTWYLLTRKRRREENWPHPPLFVGQAKDRTAVKTAFEQNAIVLGYDVHGMPWFWPDATRIMQAVVCGATGSGKTTLLRNIITQDLFRTWGPPEQPRRMPMLIFDGKADSEYLAELLPAIEAAGRTRCSFRPVASSTASIRPGPMSAARASRTTDSSGHRKSVALDPGSLPITLTIVQASMPIVLGLRHQHYRPWRLLSWSLTEPYWDKPLPLSRGIRPR